MSTDQSVFPDLDAVLAVSRVEVVSNVEIETIKGALRWLFDEVQKHKTPIDAKEGGPELDDLRKLGDKQTASMQALQEKQVSCTALNDATYASLDKP